MNRKLITIIALALTTGFALSCSDTPTTTRSAATTPVQLSGSSPGNGGGGCMGDDALAANFIGGMKDAYDLNCTANDISMANVQIDSFRLGTSGPMLPLAPGDSIECVPGDPVQAITSADLENNAQERYDIGVWIGAQDSTQALHGSCLNYNLVNGTPGVSDIDGDQCGDMRADGVTRVHLNTLTLTCHNDATHRIQVPSCIGWQNSVGNTDPSNATNRICPIARAPSVPVGFRWGTTPETKAKCNCGMVALPLAVRNALRIKKVTDPSSDTTTTFNFTTTGTGYTTPFGLKNGQIHSSGPVKNGTYTASENLPAGWTLSGRRCYLTTDTTQTRSFTSITNGVELSLANGEDVTCVFTNQKNPKLTLVKRVVNDDGGTAVVGDFSINSSCGTVSFGTGVADGANTLKYTSNILSGAPGACTLKESAVTGYVEGTWSCTVGTVTNNTATNGSVTLAAGDSTTCTITNNDVPTRLTLVKRITNDNGGTKVVGDFGLSTSCGLLSFGAGVADGANTLKYTSTMLSPDPGSCTLHENLVPGYVEGSWSCNKGLVSGNAQTGSLNIARGDSIVCTISNDDAPGYLTLVKRIVNNDGGTKTVGDFGITTNAGALTFGGGTADGASTLKYTSNTRQVNLGDYTLHENVVSGYTEGTWSCNKGLLSGNAQTGSVHVGLGDTVTCTITNDDQPGTLKVIKQVMGAGSTFGFTGTGTGVPASFDIVVAGLNAADTMIYTVPAGAKSITEGLKPGYRLTDLGCSDQPMGTYDPAVTRTVNTTIANGQTVTCIFVNEEIKTTRTQGFWATHMSLTNAVWFGGAVGDTAFPGIADKTLCSPVTKDLDTIGKVLGGFWSGISQTSTKTKRSALDQARMQLVQQLLAAISNNAAFGSAPKGTISIDDAKSAYCGTDVTAIKNAAAAMAAFNESGDMGVFTPGVSANGKKSKDAANIPYWDTLP